MNGHSVDVVRHEGAGWAALLPARSKHEMLHQKLLTALEQLGERDGAVGPTEDIRLIDLHPGQLPPQLRELVAAPRQVLLGGQQVQPGLEPAFA